MEQEKINLEVLTLQDIEDCANRVLWNINPDKKKGIRTKERHLQEELICRYCYYKMARMVKDTSKENKVDRKTSKTIRANMFSMQQIIEHLGTYKTNHSNVLHGIRSLDNMLAQKLSVAVKTWEDMQNEIYKTIIKKDKDAKLAKRFLIGGL